MDESLKLEKVQELRPYIPKPHPKQVTGALGNLFSSPDQFFTPHGPNLPAELRTKHPGKKLKNR